MPGFLDPHAVLHNPAYIHESAWLYGKVTVDEGASVWCLMQRGATARCCVVPLTCHAYYYACPRSTAPEYCAKTRQ